MSKKQDFILDYIKNLEVGSKVSIRCLADSLNVSEGTAYKAIKKAEEAGLVHTRPRAGTIRIAEQNNGNSFILTIDKLTQYLGLSVIVPYASDFPIVSFIVGDGNISQLTKDAQRIHGNKLCIVGNRPEIHLEALKLGMHLLITGDTKPSLELIQEATKNQLCILSSNHSCHNILHFIHTFDGYNATDSTMNCAGDWMHSPEYLYYNDILSDWYRTYFPIFSLNNKFAIVNDNLDICGSLNAAAIIHASPEERISDLYDPNANISSFTIQKNASIHDAAQKMIVNNTELLFTEENGKLQGYLTANDILRYYHFHQSPAETSHSLRLIHSEFNNNHCTQTYDISSDFSANKENLMSILSNIASEHVRHYYKKDNYTMISGNFYTTSMLEFGSELYVQSEIIHLSDSQCLCDISINSKGSNQWRYSFYYSAV